MARELKLSYIIEATERGATDVLGGMERRLDALGRSYAGLAGMVGGGIQIKASIDEDSYFRQLAALTETPLASVTKIKNDLHQLAIETKVSSDELVHGMAAYRAAGGSSLEDFDKSARGAAEAVAILGGQG